MVVSIFGVRQERQRLCRHGVDCCCGGRDVVSKFNESVRKSKYGAMAIIAVLALTTLATMVSQLLNILEKFGLTPRWILERIAQ